MWRIRYDDTHAIRVKELDIKENDVKDPRSMVWGKVADDVNNRVKGG